MSESLTAQAIDEDSRRRLAVIIQFVQLAELFKDQIPDVLQGPLAAALPAIRLEPVPLSPLDRRCADALADEVAALVRRGIIDSRSPAADVLLDYRNPPSSPRADRLAELESLVDAIVKIDPVYDNECALCTVGGLDRFEDGPNKHAVDCPWRLARALRGRE